MERATVRRASRTRPATENPEFLEYLKREGITLAEWQQRQRTNAGDADSQALRLARRKLKQHTR